MRVRLRPITPRRAGRAGILGVVLFAATVAVLTVVEFEYMLSAGWRPLSDPGSGWPSGLALGEHGWAMNVVFVVSGMLLVVFAVGLRREIGGRFGSILLLVSGVAMAMMAFETDPILRVEPRTFHGWIHDISFVVFAASMLAGMLVLSREFGKVPGWKPHARRTLFAALLAVACLPVPGVTYYLFIAVLLAWLFATSMRLTSVNRI